MSDGDEFSTQAKVEVQLDRGSLRQARQTIESELGAAQVGITDGGQASGQLGGGRSSRQIRRERRTFRLDQQRNEHLETIVELLDDLDGEGGGGLLDGLLGGAGRGLGTLGLGAGAGLAGLGIGAGVGLATGDLPEGIGKGLGNAVGLTAEGIGSGIGEVLGGGGDFAEGVGEGLGGVLGGTGNFAEGVGSGIGDTLGGIGEGSGEIIDAINPTTDSDTNIDTLETDSVAIDTANIQVGPSEFGGGGGDGPMVEVEEPDPLDVKTPVLEVDEPGPIPVDAPNEVPLTPVPVPVEPPSGGGGGGGFSLDISATASTGAGGTDPNLFRPDSPQIAPIVDPGLVGGEEGGGGGGGGILGTIVNAGREVGSDVAGGATTGLQALEERTTPPQVPGPSGITSTAERALEPNSGSGGGGGRSTGRPRIGFTRSIETGNITQDIAVDIDQQAEASGQFDVVVEATFDELQQEVSGLEQEVADRISDLEQDLRSEIETLRREIRRGG